MWRIIRVAGRSALTPSFLVATTVVAFDAVLVLYRLLLASAPTPWIATVEWVELGAAGGVLVGLALLLRADITTRREHAKLSQREQQLRLLTDALPVAISYVDRDECYRYNSAAFEVIFSRSRDLVEGRPLREVIPASTYREVEPFLRRAAAGEEMRFKLRVPLRRGRVRTFDVHYVPDRDIDGSVRGLYIVSSDITQHEDAERALHEATEKYRTVVEKIREGMFIAQNDRFVFANPALHAMLEYAPGELLGKPINEVITMEDYPRWRELLALSSLGQIPPGEHGFTLRRKSGEGCIQVELRATASQYEGASAVLGTVVDVTARKAQEQELQNSEERLRQLQADLSHVQRLSAVGETAATLAHELNQPLSAIVSYLEGARLRFAQEIGANPALGEMFSHIARVARRASEVVRSVRNMAAKGQADMGAVDVNSAVQKVMRLFDADAARRGATIRLNLSAGLPLVAGNDVQIEQLLVNLIGNAMEAMEDTDVLARDVIVSTGVAGNGEVEICVSDSGPGIDPAVRNRLFTPFFTTKPKGLGMGLAVCRSIVERHGGRIWVDTERRGGAAFHVLLPKLHEEIKGAG